MFLLGFYVHPECYFHKYRYVCRQIKIVSAKNTSTLFMQTSGKLEYDLHSLPAYGLS